MSKDRKQRKEQSGSGDHMKKFNLKIEKERKRLKKQDKK
jgi:hypothetical protein